MVTKISKDEMHKQAIRNLETEIRNLKYNFSESVKKNETLSAEIRTLKSEKEDMGKTILSYDDLIKAYRSVTIDLGRAIDHEQKQPFFEDKIFVIREGRKLYLK